MGAGICIVLVTALAAVVLTHPPVAVSRLAPVALAAPSSPHVVPVALPRARASPEWLQRFLN